MKTYLASITLLSSLFLILACNKEAPQSEVVDVPEAVQKAFEQEYKDVKNPKWSHSGVNFEVEFMQGETESEIVYDNSGIVIERESEIPLEGINPAITTYLTTNYPAATAKEADKIENSKGVFFEVMIKDGENERELIFDEQGNFVKEEIDDEDDTEGEMDDVAEKKYQS